MRMMRNRVTARDRRSARDFFKSARAFTSDRVRVIAPINIGSRSSRRLGKGWLVAVARVDRLVIARRGGLIGRVGSSRSVSKSIVHVVDHVGKPLMPMAFAQQAAALMLIG